jgi:hypothetical protein
MMDLSITIFDNEYKKEWELLICNLSVDDAETKKHNSKSIEFNQPELKFRWFK